MAKDLDRDGRVANIELLKYDLRSDFQARHNLVRTTGGIARVTRRLPRTNAEAMHDDQHEERYVLPAYEEVPERKGSRTPQSKAA
ncbi:MAG: hypothetical protein WKF94_01645 [Solirubrobacteraceae bacterium]